MKTTHRKPLTILLLLVVLLASCHKEEEVNKEPKVAEQPVDVQTTSATFDWTVDWPGKLSSVVEVSESQDMSHSQTFGSEAETLDHHFRVTASGLKENKEYYYRYWVWNQHYVNDKFKTDVKRFTTLADVPKVKTVEVSEVGRTTAKVTGEVMDASGAAVTQRGVCWDTGHNPTTVSSHAANGSGTGTYTVTLENLEVGQTYYVRAYAVNEKGTAYGEELSFVTGDAMKPTVTTMEVTNIEWRSATGGGMVTDDGDATVIERGICWATSPQPEIGGNHATSGTGTGSFTIDMTDLIAGTTYYVRAYAKNAVGLSYGEEVVFHAKDPELAIVVTGEVTEITYTTAHSGGMVTSDGGTEVTEWGLCWNTSHNPTVVGDHAIGSDVMGDFTAELTGLTPGTAYYVRAYVKNSVGVGYGVEKQFTTLPMTRPTVRTAAVVRVSQTAATGQGEVTDDGGTVLTECGIYYGTSPNPSVTGTKLTASSAENVFSCQMNGLNSATSYYVCAYATNSQGTGYGEAVRFSTPPEGALGAPYSIGADSKVYFSCGNLQYKASTDTWRFAEHQYDYVGDDNANISSTYSGWIDLFGWGTSGWNSGANCYQPWSTSASPMDYFPGGSNANHLTGDYANADWGVYNAISNGGNQAGLWRTLTREEWKYLIDTRTTSSGLRYAKACVNGVDGLILLPDDWNESYYPLGGTNEYSTYFSVNTISLTEWSTIEAYGAVFLPVAGSRDGTTLYDVGLKGYYWSATAYDNRSFYLGFHNEMMWPDYVYSRCSGYSVRLVRPIQQ